MGEFVGEALKVGLDAMLGTARFMILADAADLGTNPSVLTVVATEKAEAEAYSRKSLAVSASTYDATQLRSEVAGLSATYSVAADQLTLDYNTIVLLADATSWANQPIDSIDPATNRITIAAHGLSNGDKVSVTADIGGTVTTELQNAVFTVSNATTNDFQLSNGSGVVDFGGTGVLPLRIRNCSGRIVYIESLSAQQLLPGEARTITVFPSLGRSTANVTNP